MIVKSRLQGENHFTAISKINVQVITALLSEFIPILALAHGARKELTSDTISLAVELLKNKFQMLSIAEIEEAYASYQAGQYEINATPYSGMFSLEQLGKILVAYRKERRKVVARILELEALGDLQIQNQAKRKAFKEGIKEKVVAAKVGILDWRKVPSNWYELFQKEGWLVPELSKANIIFAEAKHLGFEEKKAEGNSGAASGARVKAIAQKLYVFRYCLKNPKWKPVK